MQGAGVAVREDARPAVACGDRAVGHDVDRHLDGEGVAPVGGHPGHRMLGLRGVKVAARPARARLEGDVGRPLEVAPRGGRRVVRSGALVVDGVELRHEPVLRVALRTKSHRQSGTCNGNRRDKHESLLHGCGSPLGQITFALGNRFHGAQYNLSPPPRQLRKAARRGRLAPPWEGRAPARPHKPTGRVATCCDRTGGRSKLRPSRMGSRHLGGAVLPDARRQRMRICVPRT